MTTNDINKLIELYKELAKQYDSIYAEIFSVESDLPEKARCSLFSELSQDEKEKVISLNDKIRDISKKAKALLRNTEDGWHDRVAKVLYPIGGVDLVNRFMNPRPIGLGGSKMSEIARKLVTIRHSLIPVFERLANLAEIIYDLIEKKYKIRPATTGSIRNIVQDSRVLFSFSFDSDNDRLCLNGREFAKHKYNTLCYDYLLDAFRHSRQRIYVEDDKILKTIKTTIGRYKMPKTLRKAFFKSSGNYFSINMAISKTDIVRYCKDSEELAELIRKYS